MSEKSEYKVEVKNLTKYFGDLHVLNDISFNVKKGEFICIIKLRRRTGKTVNIRLHLTQKPFGGQGTLPVQRRQHPLGSIQRIGRVRRLCHAVGIYEKRIAGADLQLIFPVPGVFHSRQDKAVGIPEQFKFSP